ncbi:MAG TPA: ATP-binding protein [Streptosporangiaceae bacterium]
MTGDLRASPRRRMWRRRRKPSIRNRVLTIALIPSSVMLITGASVAGYLVNEGLSARQFAAYFGQSSGTMLQITSDIQHERTISLQALAGNRQAKAGLQAQWNTTNKTIGKLITLGNTVTALNPGAALGSNTELHKLAAALAEVRQGVRSGRANPSQVDGFYSSFDVNGSPFYLGVAYSAPDSASAVDQMLALDVNALPDVQSHALALATSWLVHGPLSPADRLELAQLAGAYRTQFQTLMPRLSPDGRAAATRLEASPAWRTASAGEDNLVRTGMPRMPLKSWVSAEDSVSTVLLGLWGDELKAAQFAAVDSANRSLERAAVIGSIVLGLSIAAFIAAILLANVLVRRLRRLRSDTLELSDVTLPSVVSRIGNGEQVDVESEVTLSRYGDDEIGQVADAFNTAQQTAVTAAASEARTRAGVSKVFLDIAHRSQLVVHRQLDVLDVAERKQSEPEHLELLFQLDHLATRARRNAENLLILGGGQPGRKWRKSAGLEDIVRSAVSETEHFARVNTVRLPDVQIEGSVVGDLIHLLAELVDNATVFSPPKAPVRVSGNVVGKGVVVEIEDQGLGIEHEERERLNETLRNPPDFQVMALSGQRHLGLFVVGQLAQRHGIKITLLESAYGGIRAITLIPSRAMEDDGPADVDSSAVSHRGLHEQPQPVLAGTASISVPEPRRGTDANPLAEPPPAEPPLAEPLQPAEPDWMSATLPELGVSAAPPAVWEAPPGAPDPAPQPARGGRAPLPHRERMANLAPELRADVETSESTQTADIIRSRRPQSPEEARGSMSAFQRGTRLGREAMGQDNR